MGDVPGSADAAVDAALGAVNAALHGVAAVELGAVSDAGLVAVLQALERLARRMGAASHPVLTLMM